MSDIPSRKRDHVELCSDEDVRFRSKSNGFERWEFDHNAVPELDFTEIDTSIHFLGKPLSFPFFVAGMTGGYAEAARLNAQLAEVCEAAGIAMGVGSQRQALESDVFNDSYSIARTHAPTIPLVANIGAAEVAHMRKPDAALRIVDLISADAIAVHCNPLQEFLQPEGNPSFRGVLDGIAMLVAALPVPVIVKEVGAGISRDAARRLYDTGVRYIDVAGAGGTSWAGVEMLRRTGGPVISPSFWDWGIPAADALHEISTDAHPGLSLISSGGITDGVMIAKSIALGATLAAAARPILLALRGAGSEGALALLKSWKNDFRGVMFLTGVHSVSSLAAQPLRRIH